MSKLCILFSIQIMRKQRKEMSGEAPPIVEAWPSIKVVKRKRKRQGKMEFDIHVLKINQHNS